MYGQGRACGPASGPLSRPARVAPMTTTDSPSAIRMKAWQRSARWPPSMFHSRVRDRPSPGVQNPAAPPARSTPTAASHRASRAPGRASPPATASPPLTQHQHRMRSKLRRSDPAGSAQTVKALRPTCMTAYAPPTSRPPRPKASGSPADMTRLTSIRPSSSSRTGMRSGSSQFVTQVV